jgi:signal transduction histidine kinase
MVKRTTRFLLAAGVLFTAVLALSTSTAAFPESGLSGGGPGDVIDHVDPGSPVWRSGIRAGDRIAELRVGLEPGGWRIVTTSPDGTTRQSTASVDVENLRRFVPWSIIGVVVAAFAALLALRGHPAAAPLLPLAFAFAAQPLFVAGSLLGGLFAGVAVLFGSALAIMAFTVGRRLMVAVACIGAGLAGGWVLATIAAPAAFDALDTARIPAAAGFSLVGLASVLDRRRVRGWLVAGAGFGFVDVAYAGTCVGLLIAAGVVARVPVEFLVVAALVATAVYPIWRRNAIAAFDRFVTSRARRDAAILAIEEERGRLARDIHDTPLQDLSGVIRRLDAVPGAEREADALRDVAARLRDVATALRPPVLQDLGLVAAIEDLRDQLAGAHHGWEMVADIDDVTGGRRPPADVELAALRVVQEAAANAVAHSGGRRLVMRGSVAADAIDIRMTDDGRGYRDEDARDARRAGHFGLDSMRERAEAVGAEVVVGSTSTGVTVGFRWERPS